MKYLGPLVLFLSGLGVTNTHTHTHVRSNGSEFKLCPCVFGLISVQEIQVRTCEAAEQAVKISLIRKKLQLDD